MGLLKMSRFDTLLKIDYFNDKSSGHRFCDLSESVKFLYPFHIITTLEHIFFPEVMRYFKKDFNQYKARDPFLLNFIVETQMTNGECDMNGRVGGKTCIL